MKKCLVLPVFVSVKPQKQLKTDFFKRIFYLFEHVLDIFRTLRVNILLTVM